MLVQLAKGMLSVKTGDEGPRHDPYGYIEWTLVTPYKGKSAQLHCGLAEFAVIDGKHIEDDPTSAFEQYIGVTLKSLERAMHRIRSRCKCGCTEFRTMDGYPGETMAVCTECQNIVYCDFDKSAVE